MENTYATSKNAATKFKMAADVAVSIKLDCEKNFLNLLSDQSSPNFVGM